MSAFNVLRKFDFSLVVLYYCTCATTMANPEVDSIVREGRELMSHISTGEQRIEEMLRRAHAINEKVACMREYQSSIDAINSLTINGERRTVLLDELQRENRQIMAYQEENRNLREAVDECIETLSIVMARHRAIMVQISRQSNVPSAEDVMNILPCSNTFNNKKDKLRNFATELSSHIKRGEDVACVDLEKIAQLAHENKVLREILLTAEISSPGVNQRFLQIITSLRSRWKAKKDNETIRTDEDSS